MMTLAAKSQHCLNECYSNTESECSQNEEEEKGINVMKVRNKNCLPSWQSLKMQKRGACVLGAFPLRLCMQFLLLHHAVIWLPVK